MTLALAALKAVWHRGAVDADGKTGDGAGILVDAPQDFFREQVSRTGHTPKDGPIFVGQIFLPRLDLGAQERARVIVESEIIRAGFVLYGWRQVPVNISQIGEKANATRPEIEQVLLHDPQGRDDETVDRDLFIVPPPHRKARARRRTSPNSMSARCQRRRLIYKGMFLAAADRRVLSRSARRALRLRRRDLSPALFAPTRSRNGAWRSRSACSRTMARSTR